MGRQAGSAYIDFTARTSGVTTGLEKARAEARKAARQMKADFREAQGTLALVGEEVGVHLPRHLRAFIAELPGVATALSAAFSGAAIIGLGMIAVEQAKKIYEAFEKMHELPTKIAEDFEKLTGTLKAQNDELRLANIELENAINKFKGVPENRLAEGLAAATVEAEKLAAQLNKDDDAVQKLFKDNQVSIWGKIFERMAGTDDLQKQIDTFRKDINKTTDDALTKLRKDRDTQKPKDFNAEVAAMGTTVHGQYEGKLKDLNTQLTEANTQQALFASHWTHGAKDMTAVIKVLEGSIAALSVEEDNAGLMITNMTLKQEKFGETGKSAAERAKDALADLREELNRDTQNYEHGIKFQQELTDSLTQTWMESYRVQQQGETQAEEARKKTTAQFIADRKREQEVVSQTQESARSDATEDYELFAQQSADKVAMGQETNTQRNADLRAMLITQEQQAQESFATELNEYADNQAKQIEILRKAKKEEFDIEHELNVLTQEDRSNSLQGMFDDMIKRAEDTAATIKGLFTSLMDGINEQLVNMMTGKRVTSRDWKNMFSGVAGQVAKSGLQTAEGKLLGMKRDGSSPQSALYTINAGDLKKTGKDLLGAAKGSPDPSTANTGPGGGGFFSSIFGAMLSLVPHASGGPVVPGTAYLVGERGPEPFFPGVSGTIGTNAAMRSAFGGGGGSATIHMPIDARGSNDPAAVNAAVHRAMRAYAPTLIGASAAFQNDQRRRGPALSAKTV